MRKCLIGLIISPLVFVSCGPETTGTHDRLMGAWEIVDYANLPGEDYEVDVSEVRGLFIFTEKHYSVEMTWKDRPAWPEGMNYDNVGCEQLSESYIPFTSNTGFYHIKGDSIYFHVKVSKDPNYMKIDKVWSSAVTFDKEQLVLRSTFFSALTFNRVE